MTTSDLTAVFNTLTAAEQEILRDTGPDQLAPLDEDQLLQVHARIRRARDKYVGQYRRQAAARVEAVGGRGKARAENRRARDKAEIFETALADVSTAVAKAAKRSAASLRRDRLAAARKPLIPVQSRVRPRSAPAPNAADERPPEKSTGRIKKDASTRAMGARRQARKDTRNSSRSGT